ncbi:putative JmjC domain-containing histone demethylation protein 2C [Geranomyces variabilis]|uniref:JmjC domain-containing histone demethylation protein 2C n=1 Tax=Geranomyces variabilis TaxID=109894 RepID=A0AAD5TCT9_9FUNG|nr:putative JmjC domain-containing histone demethylation protein 2C [Geranomyces variabilis]
MAVYELSDDSDDAPLQKRAAALLLRAAVELPLSTLSEESHEAPLPQRGVEAIPLRSDELVVDALGDAASLQHGLNSPHMMQDGELGASAFSQPQIDVLSAEVLTEDSHDVPSQQRAGASTHMREADEFSNNLDATSLQRELTSPPAQQNGDAGTAPPTTFPSAFALQTISATPSLAGDPQQSVYPLPSPPVELEFIPDCVKASSTGPAAGAMMETNVILAQHDGLYQETAGRSEKYRAIVASSLDNEENIGYSISLRDEPHELQNLAIDVDVDCVPIEADSSAAANDSSTKRLAMKRVSQVSHAPAARQSLRSAARKALRNSFQDKSAEIPSIETMPPPSVQRFRSETPTREWAREDVFPAGVKAWPRMTEFLEYQLFFVKDAFLETVDKELDHVTRVRERPHCVKAPVAGTRQTCDYCEQGIYNMYYMCMQCGKDICLLCADEGWGPTAAATTPKSQGSAATNIHRCTYRRPHGLETFLLVGRWTVEQMKIAREWMVGWFETHGERLRQHIGVRVYEPPPSRSLCMTPHSEAATDASENPHVDALIDAPHPDLLMVRARDLTLNLFQQCWRDRKAVFVTDMVDRVLAGWNPVMFRESAGSDRATLVDVVSGELHPDSPLGPFFDGFGGLKCVGDTDSLTNHPQEPRRTLKLKDWPTDMHFRQKLPDICARLLDVLPAPAYTLPDGALNLAAAIPSEDVPPDLGPKLYAAYGYSPGQTGATTNLHLDVADAANVMVWSQPHVRPDDPSVPPHRFDGAVWELFPPASLSKLRTYLRETYAPRPARIDDPIHDQTAYLHPRHLAELRALHGVTPIRLHQRPGDVVFVPAGFAHQVANYGDCIKAAVDFVSPEGMRVCDALCGEFRRLGKGHGRRGDTVCVGKIAWSVVRKAVAETSKAAATTRGG